MFKLGLQCVRTMAAFLQMRVDSKERLGLVRKGLQCAWKVSSIFPGDRLAMTTGNTWNFRGKVFATTTSVLLAEVCDFELVHYLHGECCCKWSVCWLKGVAHLDSAAVSSSCRIIIVCRYGKVVYTIWSDGNCMRDRIEDSHLQGKLPAESLSKPLIMFDACAALILLLK
jgi:hypothetical protein